METARLQIPASGENGERERYWSIFDLEGKADIEQGGLSQQVSGEVTSTRSSACKRNQLYTKRLLGRRADLMISNSCTSPKRMTFTLM